MSKNQIKDISNIKYVKIEIGYDINDDFYNIFTWFDPRSRYLLKNIKFFSFGYKIKSIKAYRF
ncbi:MAG: hypothetical protein CR982_01265 [Candidatus Cloacimonadota bacterium]|nr:MAG: hypothetical protein CR982_01265 [Candidatus Cloacimonadota bacterium]PIE77937.1 MAG: hypothetical protein CSA15_10345 [Candidatus Delongbacteria bacterium]